MAKGSVTAPLGHWVTAMIAEVVFNLPLERSFHYLIPDEFASSAPHQRFLCGGVLKPLMRVAAPFGPRELIGFVTQLLKESPIGNLKPIRRIIDPIAVIDDERWKLALWLSRYYYCSLGEALAIMVPSSLRIPVAVINPSQKSPGFSPRDECILFSAREGASAFRPMGSTAKPEKASDAEIKEKGAASAIASLTAYQRQAVGAILDRLERPHKGPILLHGVTASGKTEVYLQAIERVLELGRCAICLIPEIALTPQMVERFSERFGEHVAIWHSRLTSKQRSDQWLRLENGNCRIVVGARSAVFSPLKNIGLIILDEEHEEAYKQEGSVRYHAREVAIERARLANAVVVLGSATPSVESYYQAMRQKGALLRLPERVASRALPKAEIIDMREGIACGRKAGGISFRLQQALDETIARKEQAMLLLNRRGFARVAQCPNCATVVRCHRCSVPLIYHAAKRMLMCHYCNFQEEPAELCAKCRKGYMRFKGVGTERVESEMHRFFPTASIARMDRDTTKARESHRQLYEAIKTQTVGLLVGTQMIAKGFDFPQVTLVGVISADTSLNLPDFRSGERTFDLLTQVAGRAGRGELPGRVMIQTYYPNHYAIQAAREHDYERFFKEEIRMRRRLRLPPFARLVELTLLGSSGKSAEKAAELLAQQLKKSIRRCNITLMGPAPHRIARLRRTYRICMVLKAKDVEPIVELLRKTLQPGRRFRGLPVIVDVDPL